MCEPGHVSRAAVTRIPRPRWALLYGATGLGLAALTLADVTTPELARGAVDGAVAGVLLVAVALWIRSNRPALDQQDWCECAADTLTARVIPSRRPRVSRGAPRVGGLRAPGARPPVSARCRRARGSMRAR